MYSIGLLAQLVLVLSDSEQRLVNSESRNEIISEQAAEALSLAEDAILTPNSVSRPASTLNLDIGLILVGTAASQTSDRGYRVTGLSFA